MKKVIVILVIASFVFLSAGLSVSSGWSDTNATPDKEVLKFFF